MTPQQGNGYQYSRAEQGPHENDRHRGDFSENELGSYKRETPQNYCEKTEAEAQQGAAFVLVRHNRQ